MLPGGYTALPHPVVTADVPRVDARVVRGLDAAQPPRAALQKPVAVGAATQLTPGKIEDIQGVTRSYLHDFTSDFLTKNAKKVSILNSKT